MNNLISKLFEKAKADIVQERKTAVGGVCVTADCLTPHATESYMTVTAHFVTKNMNLDPMCHKHMNLMRDIQLKRF